MRWHAYRVETSHVTTYLVHAAIDEARAAYQDWLLSKPPILHPADSDPSSLATVHARFSAANDEYSFITIKLATTGWGKGQIIGAMLPSICLAEILILASSKAITDNLFRNLFANAGAVVVTGAVLGLILLACWLMWLILTPTRVLALVDELMWSVQFQFLDSLLGRGIASRWIIPPNSDPLFVQDRSILLTLTPALALFQLVYFTGVAWPALYVTCSGLLVFYLSKPVVSELANREAERQHNWRGNQRLAQAKLGDEVGTLFFIPAGFCVLLWLSAQLNSLSAETSAAQGQNTTLELFSHLTLDWPGALVAGEAAGSRFLLEYFGRAIRVGTIGNSVLNTWIVLAVIVPIAGAVVMIGQLRALLEKARSVEFWRDLFPSELGIPSPSSPGRWATATFALEWLEDLTCNVAGVAVLVAAASWMISAEPSWVPVGLRSSFLWYQSTMEFLVGPQLGKLLASAVVTVLFAPVLIWLAMWVVSALLAISAAVWAAFGLSRIPDRVDNLLSEVGEKIAGRAPIIRLDRFATGWPITTAFLPFSRFALVRVPGSLLDELDDQQMRLVLAHEVGHAMLHVRRIWIAGLLSRSNLGGSVHIEATFDYARMEFEADEFAVSLTGDIGGFEALMSALGDLEARRQRGLSERRVPIAVQQLRRLAVRLPRISLFSDLLSLYGLYFGSKMVTYTHPSPDERVAYVRQRLLFNKVALSKAATARYPFEQEDREHMPRKFVGTRLVLSRELFYPIDASVDRFGKLTEAAKQALALSENAAVLRGSRVIGTTHLLIGVYGDGSSNAAKILQELTFGHPQTLLDELSGATSKDETPLDVSGSTLQLSSECKRAIEAGVEEAGNLRHDYIGTEHLLLGILATPSGTAFGILSGHRWTLGSVRTLLLSGLR